MNESEAHQEAVELRDQVGDSWTAKVGRGADKSHFYGYVEKSGVTLSKIGGQYNVQAGHTLVLNQGGATPSEACQNLIADAKAQQRAFLADLLSACDPLEGLESKLAELGYSAFLIEGSIDMFEVWKNQERVYMGSARMIQTWLQMQRDKLAKKSLEPLDIRAGTL